LAQTAKDLNPSLTLVYEALSSVHLFKGQHEEALAAANRWLEVEPGNAEALACSISPESPSGSPD
jgi:hypothetical protein